MSNYRNRNLLDLAYKIDCQAQIPGVCQGGPGEPAHDVFFASGCRACHVELDQGKRLHREERRAIWQEAHERTMLELWRLALVRVA